MPTYLSPGVYIEEIPSGSMPLSAAGTAVAAFVGYTAGSPRDDLVNDPEGRKPRMVTNWTQYTDFYGGFTDTALLPNAVHGFFTNGGSRCYIVRIPHRIKGRAVLTLGAAPTLIAIDPQAEAQAALGQGTGDPPSQQPRLEFTSLVEDAVLKVTLTPTPSVITTPPEPAASPPPTTFDVVVEQLSAGAGAKTRREFYKAVTLGQGDDNVVAVINAEKARKGDVRTDDGRRLIAVASVDEPAAVALPGELTATLASTRFPAPTAAELAPDAPPAGLMPVVPETWDGSAERREGIQGLVIAEDVTMVMVPDLLTMATRDDGTIDEGFWATVQGMVKDHCEGQRNRMAILEPPPKKSPQDVFDWLERQPNLNSKFATLYYPWLEIIDPSDSSGRRRKMVPPCGHMAGIWTRTDQTRGVWKAPANEPVRGIINVEHPMTTGEQDLLNPEGINAIRKFGSRGIVVWGARTLEKTDPSWRYINVRRLFNMVEQTIIDGTQWVVFEPNDPALWARVNRTVYSFLLGLWRDGALFGSTPEQAFFVKCDGETNPPNSIDEGKLIVEVGIAPVKPAEFVIFRISQKALEAAS